ncbi:MAG: SOS response-associated peptidase [Thermodesulfobacteriota bacterium]
MCGRFVRKGDKDLLEERFGCDARGILLAPGYNIAPSQDCPVVTVEGDRRVLGLMRWGLVPAWAEDAKIGYRMINARGETVAEKQSFKTLLRKSRCLVPASGFYEWKKQKGGGKTPYFFGLRGGAPFAFAGLWTVWHAGREDEIRSFTIVTTSANELMAPVHDRMPVILHEKDEARWLDPEIGKPGDLLPLLVPYPSGEMECWEVSPYVNSYKNQGEECIRPLSSEEKNRSS